MPRALASFQVTGVVFAVTGTAVGGMLVNWSGLTAAAGFDAMTFGVMIAVLLVLRTVHPARADAPRPDVPVDRGRHADGVRPTADASAADHDDDRRRAADADGLLLLPLLARDHQWDAATAGLLVASRSLGVGVIAVRILVRGAFPRPGMFAAFGLLLAAVGSSACRPCDPSPSPSPPA